MVTSVEYPNLIIFQKIAPLNSSLYNRLLIKTYLFLLKHLIIEALLMEASEIKNSSPDFICTSHYST